MCENPGQHLLFIAEHNRSERKLNIMSYVFFIEAETEDFFPPSWIFFFQRSETKESSNDLATSETPAAGVRNSLTLCHAFEAKSLESHCCLPSSDILKL